MADLYDFVDAAVERLQTVPELHGFLLVGDEPEEITELNSVIVGPSEPAIPDYQKALRGGLTMYALTATVIVGAEGGTPVARDGTRRLLGQLIAPSGPVVTALQAKGRNLPDGRDRLSRYTNDNVAATSLSGITNFSRNRAHFRIAQIGFVAVDQDFDGRDPNAPTQG